MTLRIHSNQFDLNHKVKVNYDKFGDLPTESEMVSGCSEE